MKALVTGASGFIGGYLAWELCRRGHKVFCLVRPTSSVEHLEDSGVVFVSGELRDNASLAAAVRGMDYVFHLAAVINALDWRTYEDANVGGTRNLVQACLGAAPGLKKFVFVSSISAAGPSPEGRPLTETDECRPISLYGLSKLKAEEAVLAAKGRLPLVVVRPPNVLGPRQRDLMQSMRLIRRRIIPVLGNGRPQTSLADVEDVVRALILAAENPRSTGEVYFITDGRAYSWREISAAVASELGIRGFHIKVPYSLQATLALFEERSARAKRRPPRLTRDQVRAVREYYWIYDGSKIERDLGFRPAYNMRDSIQRAVAWFLEQEGRGLGKNSRR